MRRCAFLAVLACSLVSGLAANAADLAVMTFNVRYGSANDGDNSWPHRRETLVNAIRQHTPDVLGLQECLDFQADYIAGELPEYDWFGIGRRANGTGEMTPIFYRKDRFLPLSTGTFWLSETPDVPGSQSWASSLPRIATWGRLYDLAEKRSMNFINTHFDHRSVAARLESAKLLAKRAAALAGSIVITGDFNARGEESAPWKALTDSGLLDAWQTAAERKGPQTTWCGWQAPDPESDKRIDWILYRGKISPIHCEAVTYNEDGRYPSDHFPVVCQFQQAN